MLREAGELAIPFTTGLLIGIGETLAERVDTLLAIRDLHRQHGHVQEVIVQNFRRSRRSAAPTPTSPTRWTWRARSPSRVSSSTTT
jgi:FO synthase